jgi:hypothetical protein
MEYLCVKKVYDLDELKGDVSRLVPPSVEELGEGSVPGGEEIALPLPESGMVRMALPAYSDVTGLSGRLLARMDQRDHAVPEAVFIGGSMEREYLAAFFRPLAAGDFVGLWSQDSGGSGRPERASRG